MIFKKERWTGIWMHGQPANSQFSVFSSLTPVRIRNGNWHIEDILKNPGKQMRSVWAIGTPKSIEKKFGKHPTQKPLDLLKRIVIASTNENNLILDPFTGSSTTGLAAYLYGRNFVGIDTEREYLDLSVKRFEEISTSNENVLF